MCEEFLFHSLGIFYTMYIKPFQISILMSVRLWKFLLRNITGGEEFWYRPYRENFYFTTLSVKKNII